MNQPAPEETEPMTGLMKPDMEGRLFATCLFPIVWLILMHTPLPFINFESFPAHLPNVLGGSVLERGLDPFLLAYVLLAIFALFVPFLKKRCHQNLTGPLQVGAYVMGLFVFFLLAHGYMDARYYLSAGVATSQNDGLVILSTMITSAVAGLLSLLIAVRITRKGLLHGISLYILVFTLFGLSHGFSQIEHYDVSVPARTRAWLANGLLAVASILLVVYSETRREVRRSEDGNPLVLRAVPAGVYPAVIILGLVNLANVIAEIIQYQGLLYSFQLRWLLVCGFLILVLYVLLGKAFYPSKTLMSEARWGGDRRTLLADFHASCVRGAAYLFLVVVFPQWLFNFMDIPLLVNGLDIIFIVTIMMDAIMEYRARNAGFNTPVAAFNNVPDVDRARVMLEDGGVPVWVRSYHHRALLYFFGPYLEMSLHTVAEDKDKAAAILSQAFPPEQADA